VNAPASDGTAFLAVSRNDPEMVDLLLGRRECERRERLGEMRWRRLRREPLSRNCSTPANLNARRPAPLIQAARRGKPKWRALLTRGANQRQDRTVARRPDVAISRGTAVADELVSGADVHAARMAARRR
jgi:hypothetical protein